MQTMTNHTSIRLRAGEDPALFLAGHMAPAGTYRQLGTSREVRLDKDEALPATCDGGVAVYIRQPPTWAEMNFEEGIEEGV